jgi:hypothetical protein
MQRKKSLITMPVARRDPVLYPCFIPVFINAKKAGPKEKVRSRTIINV